MSDYHEWDSIEAVTPTICDLLGVAAPALAIRPALNDVLIAARETFGSARAEKCLVFAPDALGYNQFSRFPGLLAEVRLLAPIEVRLQSMIPPKTPVCFASMFTGAGPEQHGIRKYEKPVLQCDTLFDALIRAGKRVAIVAVRDSSIDRIFRGRELDYFSETYDREVTDRVISLLASDRHDFILAYHLEYDDLVHASNPFTETAMRAARNHIAAFARIVQAVDLNWGRYDRMVAFVTDHGAHADSAGRGGHGEDISEDMELKHFYGFRRASSA